MTAIALTKLIFVFVGTRLQIASREFGASAPSRILCRTKLQNAVEEMLN